MHHAPIHDLAFLMVLALCWRTATGAPSSRQEELQLSMCDIICSRACQLGYQRALVVFKYCRRRTRFLAAFASYKLDQFGTIGNCTTSESRRIPESRYYVSDHTSIGRHSCRRSSCGLESDRAKGIEKGSRRRQSGCFGSCRSGM
jgi:hypothetical protein